MGKNFSQKHLSGLGLGQSNYAGTSALPLDSVNKHHHEQQPAWLHA